MVHKHFCAGMFMLLGLAFGVSACSGADESGLSQQWAGDDLSAQSANDEADAIKVIAPSPQFPNCGILACPTGTTCKFDSSNEARCTAPPGTTCSQVNCGPYYYCQMTPTGAICLQGASDS